MLTTAIDRAPGALVLLPFADRVPKPKPVTLHKRTCSYNLKDSFRFREVSLGLAVCAVLAELVVIVGCSGTRASTRQFGQGRWTCTGVPNLSLRLYSTALLSKGQPSDRWLLRA